MSNKLYDTLKWIALIFLPALGTLYFAIAKIWNLPYLEEIVGTITAIDTFLGTLLKIANINYENTIAQIKQVEMENEKIKMEEQE